MLPFAVEAVPDTSWWEEGAGHLVIFLGIIGSIFAIIAGVRAWKKEHKENVAAREEAIIARSKNEELLTDIAKEFRPNHGSSLVDRVNSIGTSLDSHCEKADKWFKENDAAHEEIKRLHT